MSSPPEQQQPTRLPLDPAVQMTYDVLVGVAWTFAAVSASVLATMCLIWGSTSPFPLNRVWPVSLWPAVVAPLVAACGLGITANQVTRRAAARPSSTASATAAGT